jgi:hypothetical protein
MSTRQPGAAAGEARVAPDPSGSRATRSALQQVPADESPGEVVDVALAMTSRVRELPATGPVRGVVLSRAEMAAHVRATIERDLPAEVVMAEGEVLVALGVAPPGFDYLKATVALMSDQLAGYYEPTEKTMYLAADLGRGERAATLSHELVHALQDQHYDLGKLLAYRPDESDLQGALHALAEGDATSAMLDQVLAPKGAKATDISDQLLGVQVRASAEIMSRSGDVPRILERSLVAPYVDGVAFVHWLRRRGGWAEVDRAWQSPPVSTEQLLHPDKLLAREPALVVPVPVAPEGSAAVPALTDVLGEQSIRILFEAWLPRAAAAEAAAGWGGDRVAVYHYAGGVAVGWHLRYDDAPAAARGARALRRGVSAQGATAAHAGDPAADCVERAAVGPLAVARRGRDVAVAAGPVGRGGVPGRDATCSAARAWASRILLQR